MIRSLAVVLWLACGTLAWASPADDPPSIKSLDSDSVGAPRLVVPPVAEHPEPTTTKRDPKIEGWIRDTLDGKDVGETGVPMLDEALKGLRGRGSVVDKFPELNPTERSAPPHVRPAPARQPEGAERHPPNRPNALAPVRPLPTYPFAPGFYPPSHSVQGNPYAAPPASMPRRIMPGAPLPPNPAVSESQYRTAETLLRGARMLADLSGTDPQRTETIRLMRLQAQKCLSPHAAPRQASY